MAFLTSQATQNAFNLYTTRSGQLYAQRLAPVLADYYLQNHGWQGIDAFIQSGVTLHAPSEGMGPGMMGGNGNGPGLGNGLGPGWQAAGGGMMGAMGQRLILTDAQGVVISDTQDALMGRNIPSKELSSGTPILASNTQVGTLVVTPNDISGTGSPAGEFRASVNQAIISAVLIAGLIALALGAILFIQITSPLRQLKKAAAAIARGDLSQRVPIRSRDEFGELGQTFNHMAENLAQAETQRQHAAADVAHELRTPLAAIQATLEGMQDGVLPINEENLAALHTETLLLNRLVGDLRLLSLAEAGQLPLERQEIHPGDLIQQVTGRMKPQASQQGVHLETEVSDGLPPIWIDPDRITQVLNNLIGNALRYTPEGGSITMRAAQVEAAPRVQFSVTDTGPGIDAGDLPFIFDRFYRADPSRTRASGGSGLGLAIVKGLVEAHGGTVAADSPVFQDEQKGAFGTRITFTLPIGSPQS
jgi:signal transduction histidine kinase